MRLGTGQDTERNDPSQLSRDEFVKRVLTVRIRQTRYHCISSTIWDGPTRYDTIRFPIVRYENCTRRHRNTMIWHDTIRQHTILYGTTRYDTINSTLRYDAIRCHVRYDTYDAIWYATIWCDMIRYHVRCDMIRSDMIRYGLRKQL